MSRRPEILEAVSNIPSLPSAAVQGIQMLQDPEVDIAEVTRIIECDHGLAANVLRMANSAYFSAGRPVGSLRDAIVRLGSKNIAQLVCATAVAPVAQNEVKGYGLDPGGLWEHSMAVAVGTVQFAKALGVRAPNYAFTAGLLHDVGKIVLGSFIDIDATPILALAFEEDIPFNEAEIQVLGICHAETGAELLRNWQLPEDLVEICRWHHQPSQLDGQRRLVGDLVHLADSVSMLVGLGAGIDGSNYALSKETMDRLKVEASVVEQVVSVMVDELDEAREMFLAPAGRR